MIPEATKKVPPGAVESVAYLMQGILAVRRAVQMYPAGSTYIERVMADCLEHAYAVLRHVDAVTLKERANKLEVNGVAYPMSRWGTVGDDMVAELRRAEVHSLTLTRRVAADDLQGWALGVLHFARSEAGLGDWETFVSEHSMRGLGVVPKRFKATADGAQALAEGVRLEGLALDPQLHLPLLRRILRFTAGAAEAVALYPRGSETARRALAGLIEALGEAHELVGTINLGVGPDGFLINDLRLGSRRFGGDGEVLGLHVLTELMEHRQIGSLSFHRGVEAEEIRVLLEYLRSSDEEVLDWPRRLRELGVHKAEIDTYTFVAADARGGAEADGGDEQYVRIDRATFLEKLYEGDPGDLLDRQVRAALPTVMTDLVLDGDADNPQRIIRRIFLNMDAPEAPLRDQALGVVEELLAGTSSVVARELVGHCAVPLTECLRLERSPKPLARLVRLARNTSEQLLRDGDLKNAGRLLWELGRGMEGADVDADTRRASAEAISEIMRSPAFERALTALWAPNEKRKALALHLLEACGSQAAERLLKLVAESSGDAERHTHALQLKAVASADWLSDQLRRTMSPSLSAARACNILSELHLLMARPESVVLRALQHSDTSVVEAALQALARFDGEARKAVVVATLRVDQPKLHTALVPLVPDMLGPAAVELLLPLLEDESRTRRVRRAVCVALGELADERAIPVLAKLCATSRLRQLFHFGGDPDADIRLAAVWALGNFGTAEARAALGQAGRSRDSRIRAAVATLLASVRPQEE